MKIKHRPRTLTALAASTLAAIPLVALNIAVHERGPMQKVFISHAQWQPLLFFTLWTVLTARAVAQARWSGFWSFGIMSGVLLYGNAYLLLTTKNYGLAFFALGLLILCVFHSVNLHQALSLVYFDTGRRWYEAYPRFLPHILAGLSAEGQDMAPARLSSLSAEGCFVYLAARGPKPKTIALQLETEAGPRLECDVEWVSETRDGKGLGLMFKIGTADQWKDLNEFIDKAKSYGYA
jgi:hypothetical protein